MTETEVIAMLKRGGGRVRLTYPFSPSWIGKTGSLFGPYDPEDMVAYVQLDGRDTTIPTYIHAMEPEPRPWQPGDPAITDIYTGGRTEIELMYRVCPKSWMVKPGDCGTSAAKLYEEEFRRPDPALVVGSDLERKAGWRRGDFVRVQGGEMDGRTLVVRSCAGPSPTGHLWWNVSTWMHTNPVHTVPQSALTAGLAGDFYVQNIAPQSPDPAPKHEWKAGDRVRDKDGHVCYLVAPDPVRDDCSYWYASDDANLAVVDRFVDVASAVLLPDPDPIRWHYGDFAVIGHGDLKGKTGLLLKVVGQVNGERHWSVSHRIDLGTNTVDYGFTYHLPESAFVSRGTATDFMAQNQIDPNKKVGVDATKPTIREPSIECEKDWHVRLTTRAEIDAQFAKVRIIADMKAGGLDAVAKHLPALLESYGVTGEEADAIVAQVAKGEARTRETASLYTTIKGVLAWQQKESQDRRVHLQVTGHVLIVHATTLPPNVTRRVKFCTPVNVDAAAIIMDDACTSGADLIVSRDDDRLKVERATDVDLFC